MFAVGERKSEIVNHLFGVQYSSAIYRAHLIIAPGMGAVMRRRGALAFSRGWRPTAGGPTHRGGADGAEMPVRPESHLSGQPGGWLGVAASVK